LGLILGPSNKRLGVSSFTPLKLLHASCQIRKMFKIYLLICSYSRKFFLNVFSENLLQKQIPESTIHVPKEIYEFFFENSKKTFSGIQL